VQLRTPDEMLGRVSAVNALFVGTSNQLGEFESGLTAGWWGAKSAALAGGVATIAIALLWMRIFPELARMKSLEEEKVPACGVAQAPMALTTPAERCRTRRARSSTASRS
jgi:hypothetical protein